VDIGVDERGEGSWALDGRVQIKPQLGEQRVIGPKACGGDDLVEGSDHLVVAGDQDTLLGPGQPRDPESADQAQALVFDESLHALAECSSRRKRIVDAASKQGAQPVAGAANHPGDGRVWRGIRQIDEIEQGIEGGVAAADDEDTLAGIAVAMDTSDVGNAVEDAIAQAPLTDGGHAGRPQRVRGRGRAGGINDRLGENWLLTSVWALHDEEQRSLIPPLALHLVEAVAGHLDHAGIEPQPRAYLRQGGERGQIALDELASGRIDVAVGLEPFATVGQELARGPIDHVTPGGEEPDMPPGQDIGAGNRASLKDDGLLTLRQQLRRGGKTDRAGADDGDGEGAIEVKRKRHGRDPFRSR
jgi:hypothetical protein